jgi:hypothetical protein
LLKRIIRDIDVKKFIGLMLLFAGLVIYEIYFPDTVELDDAEQVRITLIEKPKYDEDAETGYDYFTLKAKGISRKFLVKYWVLNERTTKTISAIKNGSELILTIGKSEMNGKFIKRGSNTIHVLGLKEPDREWIFSLADYNQGKADRWKEYLFYGLFFGGFLLLGLIGKLKRLIKNEPEIITEIKTNEDYG